jgi:hypothetical protein
MADQTQHAPQAHPTIAVHPPPQTEASHSNFSRPTTASNAAVPAPAATPSQGTEAPVTTTTPAKDHVDLNTQLNATDRYWKFKGALQAVAVIMGLIGIGAAAWCVSTWPKTEYTYGFDGLLSVWPCLITFAVSVVWCLACILALVLRKKGIHPGLRVTIELFLWLGFLITALISVAAVLDLSQWGASGELDGYSSRAGNFELASNGTWVWDNSGSSSTTTYARDCNGTRDSYYGGYGSDSTPLFSSCAELDAYINKLWQEKPHRYSVELTNLVCQFFGLVIHLALFIWACVDCHRYRRGKVSKDAEKMAANIVQTMIHNGAVLPPPGQAQVMPGPQWGTQGMGYYQLPPQGHPAYPMANMYPQGYQASQGYQTPQGYHVPQQQYGAPQGVMSGGNGQVAGPSGEKGVGPRYA